MAVDDDLGSSGSPSVARSSSRPSTIISWRSRWRAPGMWPCRGSQCTERAVVLAARTDIEDRELLEPRRELVDRNVAHVSPRPARARPDGGARAVSEYVSRAGGSVTERRSRSLITEGRKAKGESNERQRGVRDSCLMLWVCRRAARRSHARAVRGREEGERQGGLPARSSGRRGGSGNALRGIHDARTGEEEPS